MVKLCMSIEKPRWDNLGSCIYDKPSYSLSLLIGKILEEKKGVGVKPGLWTMEWTNGDSMYAEQ